MRGHVSWYVFLLSATLASVPGRLIGQDAAAASTNEQPPAHRNRLADESSPYLLLHAHNPVDWFPWGEEALEKARQENKLIFLSVGYSSCHWCHVMERESFMDKEIADYLNRHYVCIKVDREERPDVDAIYMKAVQILTKRGGWPMSVFLTPDAKPFYGGTYFPARDNDRPGIVGFLTVVQRVQEFWKMQPELIKQDGDTLSQMIRQQLDLQMPTPLDKINRDLLDQLQQALAAQFDAEYGGFGPVPVDDRRPKFPEPSNLVFLLRRSQDPQVPNEQRELALKMLTRTLDKMAQGGIYDQAGGGFHRYSTDRFWRIPHYEKMLYDNGQLASLYAAAHAATRNPEYRRVVESTLTFVLREMTDDQGGFYSALDAESEDEEGRFYVWTADELNDLFDAQERQLLDAAYGTDQPPNFEDKYYTLELSLAWPELAKKLELSGEQLAGRLDALHRKLMDVRAKRPRPLTDTKILTSWNGLMIRGFADAGRLLQMPDYIAAAERAADFVENHLRTDDGRLMRSYAGGEARLNGYLNDYAFIVDGLIALHRATGKQKWLDTAVALSDKQIELFWDDRSGGFFFTSDDHESLLARVRAGFDETQPSGNSVSVGNLVYLAEHAKRPDLAERAGKAIASVGGVLREAPTTGPRMLVSLQDFLEWKGQ